MAVFFVPAGGSCQDRSSRLVKRLLDAGATSEWSAKPFEPRNRLEAKTVERAIRMGLVRRTDQGTLWVDEERYARWRTTQLRMVLIALLGVFLMFAILFVLGEFP